MHLQIVTGRQHQIRCHLAHVGHPVVCEPWLESTIGRVNFVAVTVSCFFLFRPLFVDMTGWRKSGVLSMLSGKFKVFQHQDGLYSSFVTFHSDCCWVPRNWLHRCRLAFQRFHGTTKTPCAQQVSMALPRDLADTLSPKLTAAAEEWQKNGFGLG